MLSMFDVIAQLEDSSGPLATAVHSRMAGSKMISICIPATPAHVSTITGTSTSASATTDMKGR